MYFTSSVNETMNQIETNNFVKVVVELKILQIHRSFVNLHRIHSRIETAIVFVNSVKREKINSTISVEDFTNLHIGLEISAKFFE